MTNEELGGLAEIAVWCGLGDRDADDINLVLAALPSLIADSRRLATLEAENARLAAKLEAIAGALADSGIDFKTTDAAEAVRELTRERDRLAALVESGRRAIASEVRDIARRIGPARLPEAIRDELDALANKLEIWSRPALLAALGEPNTTGDDKT